MNRRVKRLTEVEIHPEELMMVQVTEVEGVRRAAVHLTCWHFMRANYRAIFICALVPRQAQRKADQLRSFDLEHLARIRQWLADNPPPDLSDWAAVDRLFSLKRHLWRAVLETHRPAEVDLVCEAWGPMGDFNDDLPMSPFLKGVPNRHEPVQHRTAVGGAA